MKGEVFQDSKPDRTRVYGPEFMDWWTVNTGFIRDGREES